MPIEREFRQLASDAMLRYMRLEITGDEYFATFRNDAFRVAAERDPALKSVWCLWSASPDALTRRLSATKDGWDHMRRTRAFLQSDYEVREAVVVEERRARPAMLLVFALMLATAVGVHRLLAGWHVSMLLAAWCMPFVFALFVDSDVRRPRLRASPEGPFAPFDREDRWRSCEHLLAPLNLPVFDPAELAPRRQRLPLRHFLLAFLAGPLVVILFAMLFVAALALLPVGALLGAVGHQAAQRNRVVQGPRSQPA